MTERKISGQPVPSSEAESGGTRSPPTGADPIIQGLYSPERRQVACVLIQAAYGGDRRATNAFSAEDWFVSPVSDMAMIMAPLSQWRQIAAMPKSQRPGPQHFQRRARPDAAQAAGPTGDPGNG